MYFNTSICTFRSFIFKKITLAAFPLFMKRSCAIASLQLAITETDRAFKEKNFRFSPDNDFLR